MKQILAVVMVFWAVAAWGQSSAPIVAQPRQTTPNFDEIMKRINEAPQASSAPKRALGPIDTWRFESCQTDAAKAPTSQGVAQGMRVCREKFGQ